LILCLRKYEEKLVSQNNQFRVYVKDHKLLGICQKNVNFIGKLPTNNQIAQINKIAIIISHLVESENKLYLLK
jgi:hypothetical protein